MVNINQSQIEWGVWKERKKQTNKQSNKQKPLLSIKLNKTESSLYQKGCQVKTFKQTIKQKTISQCVKKNTLFKHKSKTKLNEMYVNKQTNNSPVW